MGERANLFGDTEFDVSDFAPAKTPAATAPPEAIRQVAEKAEFASREPQKRKPRRERRIYRTGRDANFSCKADPVIIDAFYAIADAEGWVMGETLERAVAALRRELNRAPS